jgi:hypothetical protein
VDHEPATTVPTTPVPLDAELQADYDAYMAEEPELAPMSLELLPGIRAEIDAAVAALEDLSRGGRFTVSQPSAPGLHGDPEIPLLICTPANAPASRPVLYYMHGGGFFCNDHRTGLFPVATRPAACASEGPDTDRNVGRWRPRRCSRGRFLALSSGRHHGVSEPSFTT